MQADELNVPINDDDLGLAYIPWTYRRRQYVLVEALHGDVTAWRSFQYQNASYDAEGNPTERKIKDVFESQTLLVSRCLYHADAGGKPPLNKDGDLDLAKRLPLDKVRAMPERVTSKLLERVLEMSDLAVKETKEDLEKRLTETCQKLSAFLEKPEERPLWRDWIVSEIDKIFAAAEKAVRNGRTGTPETAESPAKNVLAATTEPSA